MCTIDRYCRRSDYYIYVVRFSLTKPVHVSIYLLLVGCVHSLATPTANAAGGLSPDRRQGRLGRAQRHLDRGGGRVRRGLGLVRRRGQR